MSTLITLASIKNLLSNISEEIRGDLQQLFDLPKKCFKDSKDILALYEGRDFDVEYPCEEEDDKNRTKKFREMVWSRWLRYCEETEKDSEQVFMNLSLEKDDAKNICYAFLHSYIVNSEVRRPFLGPEEWHQVRTVRCAVTVLKVWGALVHNANRKILRPKTKKGGKSSQSWVLKFSNDKGEGPAYDVANRIPEFAETLGISLEPLVEKRPMTTEDVLLFLDTLWTKAEHIPCYPKTRNAMHCAILLGAFGGWRPGSLMNIQYQDVEFGWFSHPKSPNKVWPVVTINIHHVKQKKRQIIRTQRKMLKFTISTMVCRQICLLSHLAAKAIADNAFEANFTSPTEIVNGRLPDRPEINYVPLRWKPNMLEKFIVPISYGTYNKIWHRTLLVSGLRGAQRVVPYAMRVGAGLRLNETISGPLRNFVLNHSSRVFEANYLPKHLSENLAGASFGELAGIQNDLASSMSRVLIARDENAPIYITQDDKDSFEKRRDISALRQLHTEATVHKPEMVSKIHHEIEYILFRLTVLRLAELRKEYFMYVDRMRAEGKQIRHPDSSSTKHARLTRGNIDWPTARRIGMLLRQNDIGPDVVMQKLIGYLTNKPIEEIFPETKDSNQTKRDYQCFLCSGRYVKKFNLNRHFEEKHLNNLENGFPCPECLRGGIINPVNAGPAAWCNHVARFHGKDNAPNLKVEDSTYTNEERIGKRKRLTSTESSDAPCKKPQYDPNWKQGTLCQEKKGNTLNLYKEEGKTLKYYDEEGRKTPDPHEGEEFYVSGMGYLDEEAIEYDIGLDIKGIAEMKC